MSPCSRPILDLTPPSPKEVSVLDGDTSISTAQAYRKRALHYFQFLAVPLPLSHLLTLLPSYDSIILHYPDSARWPLCEPPGLPDLYLSFIPLPTHFFVIGLHLRLHGLRLSFHSILISAFFSFFACPLLSSLPLVLHPSLLALFFLLCPPLRFPTYACTYVPSAHGHNSHCLDTSTINFGPSSSQRATIFAISS